MTISQYISTHDALKQANTSRPHGSECIVSGLISLARRFATAKSSWQRFLELADHDPVTRSEAASDLDQVLTELTELPDSTKRLILQLKLSDDGMHDALLEECNLQLQPHCSCTTSRNLRRVIPGRSTLRNLRGSGTGSATRRQPRSVRPQSITSQTLHRQRTKEDMEPQIPMSDVEQLMELRKILDPNTGDYPEWHETDCPHYIWPDLLASVEQATVTMSELQDLKTKMKRTYKVRCRQAEEGPVASDSLVDNFNELCCCNTDGRTVNPLWKEYIQRNLERLARPISTLLKNLKQDESTETEDAADEQLKNEADEQLKERQMRVRRRVNLYL